MGPKISPPPPPPPVTAPEVINRDAQQEAKDYADLQRRRRAASASILTGGDGLGSPPVATTNLMRG